MIILLFKMQFKEYKLANTTSVNYLRCCSTGYICKIWKKLPVIIEGCLRYWVVNLKMTKEVVCCQVNVFSCLLECICALRGNVFVLSAEMYFAFEGSQWDGRMRAIQRGFPHTLVMMHISSTIFKLSFYRFTSQSQSQINNGKHCQRQNGLCKVGNINK